MCTLFRNILQLSEELWPEIWPKSSLKAMQQMCGIQCMYVPIGSNTHAPSNKVKSVLKGPSLLLCKSAWCAQSQRTLWPSQWSKIYFFYYIPWDYYTIFSFLDHSDSIAFEECSMEVDLIGFWATYYIKLRTENSRDLMRIFCF